MAADTRELRNTLGCFATGVAVVTTVAEGHRPVGITVNSFTSVSLDPPLVLWSLERDSTTFATFEAATHYTVNILTESQQDLSQRFSQTENRHMEGLACETGENGCAILPHVLAFLECAIDQRLDGGDHIILLGRVMRFARFAGQPLLFAQGKYAQVSKH